MTAESSVLQGITISPPQRLREHYEEAKRKKSKVWVVRRQSYGCDVSMTPMKSEQLLLPP